MSNRLRTQRPPAGEVSPTLREAIRRHVPPPWLPELEKIVGPRHVLSGIPDLWCYARDRSPYATFQVRNARVPATLPAAVACPGTVEEVATLVSFARATGIGVIPFGAGSGVLGGTLPIDHELIIDLKRLNRLVELRDMDAMVTVQAGMNGGQFESALNAQGYTTGHLPQSLHMSTVGGWVACRGAGQNSSRYGKIEDMVLGLEVVLPDARVLRVRPAARRAVGPGVKDLFVGSEGVFGIVTEVTLRASRVPETRLGAVLAFPTLRAGLEALRDVMQNELRPAIARLYDQSESAHRTSGGSPFDTRPFLAILEFSGPPRLAAVERTLAIEHCARHGAIEADRAPYEEWLAHRFTHTSAPWYARGFFTDTVEVTASWSRLPGMYDAMRSAVLALSPDLEFGAHWSHIYPEGACQYMTIRIKPVAEGTALALMRAAWAALNETCLRNGGAISHHHGAGLFRNAWMRGEHGVGLDLLREIKSLLDPASLFVPGKLGMSPGHGALYELHRADGPR